MFAHLPLPVAAGVTDFADDVADLVAASGEGGDKGGSLAALYGKKQLSQRYGADLATQQSKVCAAQLIPLHVISADIVGTCTLAVASSAPTSMSMLHLCCRLLRMCLGDADVLPHKPLHESSRVCLFKLVFVARSLH